MHCANRENRCRAHGKDATPKRAAAVPGTYEVGMANAPLGSAGLAVLSAAASSQELGESCGPAARKLGQSCLEARFRRVISTRRSVHSVTVTMPLAPVEESLKLSWNTGVVWKGGKSDLHNADRPPPGMGFIRQSKKALEASWSFLR